MITTEHFTDPRDPRVEGDKKCHTIDARRIREIECSKSFEIVSWKDRLRKKIVATCQGRAW